MTAVDWSRFRKCPVCGSRIGQECMRLTGSSVIAASAPHSSRKQRTGGAA